MTNKKITLSSSELNIYSTKLLQGIAYSRLHTYLSKIVLPFDVTIPEWKLLGQLHEHGEMNLTNLTQLLSYDKPMVTELVTKLEEKGFIDRRIDKTDLRSNILSLNKLGYSLLEKMEPDIRDAFEYLLGGISKEEVRVYIKVLSLIVKNTQQRSSE